MKLSPISSISQELFFNVRGRLVSRIKTLSVSDICICRSDIPNFGFGYYFYDDRGSLASNVEAITVVYSCIRRKHLK